MALATFHIRDAGTAPGDADFIVAAFDSSIAYLASTGNGGRWGSQLFSRRSDFLESTRHDVEQSLRFAQTDQGERIRIFIVEVDDAAAGGRDCGKDNGLLRTTNAADGKTMLSVGVMTVRDSEFAQHIASNDADLKPHVDAAHGNFLYVDVIVTDHRAGPVRRGAGRALLDRVKEYARGRGMSAVYVDCWTGGSGKLFQYYERHGFKAIQAFGVERHDGNIWPGVLMRLDISSKQVQQGCQ